MFGQLMRIVVTKWISSFRFPSVALPSLALYIMRRQQQFRLLCQRFLSKKNEKSNLDFASVEFNLA